MDKRPQDHGYVVQAIPVRRGVVRRGLHPENNRGGEDIQGVVAGAGGMTGVREVVGKGVTGDAPPNAARRGERGLGSDGNKADGVDEPLTYRLAFPAKA